MKYDLEDDEKLFKASIRAFECLLTRSKEARNIKSKLETIVKTTILQGQDIKSKIMYLSSLEKPEEFAYKQNVMQSLQSDVSQSKEKLSENLLQIVLLLQSSLHEPASSSPSTVSNALPYRSNSTSNPTSASQNHHQYETVERSISLSTPVTLSSSTAHTPSFPSSSNTTNTTITTNTTTGGSYIAPVSNHHHSVTGFVPSHSRSLSASGTPGRLTMPPNTLPPAQQYQRNGGNERKSSNPHEFEFQSIQPTLLVTEHQSSSQSSSQSKNSNSMNEDGKEVSRESVKGLVKELQAKGIYPRSTTAVSSHNPPKRSKEPLSSTTMKEMKENHRLSKQIVKEAKKDKKEKEKERKRTSSIAGEVNMRSNTQRKSLELAKSEKDSKRETSKEKSKSTEADKMIGSILSPNSVQSANKKHSKYLESKTLPTGYTLQPNQDQKNQFSVTPTASPRENKKIKIRLPSEEEGNWENEGIGSGAHMKNELTVGSLNELIPDRKS